VRDHLGAATVFKPQIKVLFKSQGVGVSRDGEGVLRRDLRVAAKGPSEEVSVFSSERCSKWSYDKK